MRTRTPAKIVSWLSGLLALCVCLMPCVLPCVLMIGCPFHAGAWRQGGMRQRGLMAPDLRESQVLLGKSRAEVHQLLGPPDEECDTSMRYYYVMYVPPCDGWVMWVEIAFGQDPEVVIDVALTD